MNLDTGTGSFGISHYLDVDPVVPPFRLKKICLSHAIADVNLFQRIFFRFCARLPFVAISGLHTEHRSACSTLSPLEDISLMALSNIVISQQFERC